MLMQIVIHESPLLSMWSSSKMLMACNRRARPPAAQDMSEQFVLSFLVSELLKELEKTCTHFVQVSI
jgi:hypothetical protein